MNNLLRTLTESQVKPATDLRLLLTTVKEGRRQNYDSKLSDPFYDSLEGLLLDLKTITIDNHDAEAFLKPVSKTEVPDYYEVIQHPMDFQTMLKKVKQKQYKSKREFQDDLDLIWSNCLTYNATENHPLRPCVKRLKAKAEKLLKHITDRKERTDPPIPSDLPRANGRSASHTRSPSINMSRSSIIIPARPRRGVAFAESPAIIRTPEGMSLFRDLDRQLDSARPPSNLAQTLKELAPSTEYESDTEPAESSSTGDKRKMNGAPARPRKRARFDDNDVSQMWWDAVQSDSLIGNGLPAIPFGPSSSTRTKPKKKKQKQKQPPPPVNPKSLLSLMNTNIKTMRRLRHTHAKFTALNAMTAPQEDEEQQIGMEMYPVASGSKGPGLAAAASYGIGADDDVIDEKIDEAPWVIGRGKAKTPSKLAGIEMGEANASDCLHWATDKILEHVGFQGTSTVARNVLADVTAEYLQNVGRTIRFLSDKFGKVMTPEEIILHTLFESGSSKVQDLERYISDDIERYGSRLGELEKKMVSAYRETAAGEVLEDEGLFEEEDDEETGALAMGDFADLLGEDYLGFRELGIAAELGLSNLSIPKKLLKSKKGQNKPTAAKPTEPPPPYPPPPPFIPLTAGKVEDQIGLLKPYYQNRFTQLAASLAPPPAPAGPSLPGPAMGLPGPPSLPGPSMLPPPPPVPNVAGNVPPPSNPPPAPTPTISPDLALPDELPNSSQMKIGPIGQIVKAGLATAAKKKARLENAGPPPAPGTPGGSVPVPPVLDANGQPIAAPPGAAGAGASPKKKKNLGVGSGNGRKKKPDGTAPVNGGGSGGYGGGQGPQGGPTLPPVVTASA
ncbi:Transcriptional activator spt7 [Psilocybe cubensis]|uniref:Transcriptional activator spt7 n=2 Tax=Psilocybe cubensis TaxID=181762 RepID=A0ACB8HD54_PSICU|nr:Transcriptional activator spt7 [Psilocybe cubensis]KAH9485856.1 Transcriptional activator spt7 [Psilocybe cubensis]